MLKSMTGFGRCEETVFNKTFLIEIKSLNGKQFELQLKLPAILRPYEFEIRKIISQQLLRGSVECLINLKDTGDAKPITINTSLAKAYYKSLKDLSEELNLDASQILSTLVKLPEVIIPSTESLTGEEWGMFEKVLLKAISNINDHRIAEGKSLENDLLERIQNIKIQQEVISKLAVTRKQTIRDNISKAITEKISNENYDANRFEQELIYYIEKIDISEEQVRLNNHCEYFLTLLQEEDDSKGKKLSFLLQEMGREINTTGSKAYDAAIQKCVVQMKDELEKAKEQVLNIL